MTRRKPPRLARWLLQRFAFGPQRESLIGDIVEGYQQGRSSSWYWRQALVTVFIGSATLVQSRPRRAFRALVLAVPILLFVATAGWSFIRNVSDYSWVTIWLNAGLFSYCCGGFIGLLLNITALDQPLSLSLLEDARE